MPEGVSPLHTAGIALGSNLPSKWGGRETNLQLAVERLARLGRVTAVSTFIDTAPILYIEQPRFLNAAVLLETALAPQELLRELLTIEVELGRDRSGAALAKGPRVIDLDLLFFDEVVLNTPDLTLPHPELHRRRFVLEPLVEIAPEWLHPVLRETAQQLLAAF